MGFNSAFKGLNTVGGYEVDAFDPKYDQ